MKYSFSVKSLDRLNNCHPDLQTVMKEAIKFTNIDFGIGCGYRSPAEQFELFKIGRHFKNNIWQVTGSVVTYKDGVNNLSKHNFMPSRAIDIFIAVKGKKNLAYNEKYLLYVGGLIIGIANFLFRSGIIKNRVVHGVNWDNDSELTYTDNDEHFTDLPHFQI